MKVRMDSYCTGNGYEVGDVFEVWVDQEGDKYIFDRDGDKRFLCNSIHTIITDVPTDCNDAADTIEAVKQIFSMDIPATKRLELSRKLLA